VDSISGGHEMALTKRQREILDFIEGFVRFRGYSPSFEEIAENFEYRSLATVHEHLSNLQSKGYIRKNYNESRSIELVDSNIRIAAVELRLLGSVAAGLPIEAIEERESISVPEDMIAGSVTEHYVLRVRGSSMIDEQIRDGDYVIVQSRDTAHNGEMVIALVDGENATMKKFFRDSGRVRLQPANPDLDAMYFDPDRITIQGVVIGVIRRY
jgi:repressor LexA